jgi:hypothetical protein
MPKQKRRPHNSPVPAAPAPAPAAQATQAKGHGVKPGGGREGLLAKLDKGYGKAANYQEILCYMLDQAVGNLGAAPCAAASLQRGRRRSGPLPPPNPQPLVPGPRAVPAAPPQVTTNTFDYNGLLGHPDVHRHVCELLQRAIDHAKTGAPVLSMAEIADAFSPKSDASSAARSWSLGASSASSSLHEQEEGDQHEEACLCLCSTSESPLSEPLDRPAFSPEPAGRGASMGGGGGSSSSSAGKRHQEQQQEGQRRLEQQELQEKLARQLLKQLVQEPDSPAGSAADSPRPDLLGAFGCATSPPHHYTGLSPGSRRNSAGGCGKPQPADLAADHQHRQEAFLEVRAPAGRRSSRGARAPLAARSPGRRGKGAVRGAPGRAGGLAAAAHGAAGSLGGSPAPPGAGAAPAPAPIPTLAPPTSPGLALSGGSPTCPPPQVMQAWPEPQDSLLRRSILVLLPLKPQLAWSLDGSSLQMLSGMRPEHALLLLHQLLLVEGKLGSRLAGYMSRCAEKMGEEGARRPPTPPRATPPHPPGACSSADAGGPAGASGPALGQQRPGGACWAPPPAGHPNPCPRGLPRSGSSTLCRRCRRRRCRRALCAGRVARPAG